MLRILSIVFILIGAALPSIAQSPQYYWSKWTSGPAGGFGFNHADSMRWQCVYHPSDFPAAPKGAVTNLYVRSAGLTNGSPVTYYGLTVKIGYTSETDFNHSGQDSFLTGLTTVFYASAIMFPGADTIGKWVKIPVNAGNFFYDPSKNFVVELSNGAKPLHGFFLLASNSYPDYRGAGGGPTPGCSPKPNAMEFGFDLATTGLTETGHAPAIHVYPNPAQDIVTVAYNSEITGGELEISLNSISGQQLQIHRFKKAQEQFSEKLDIRDIPKGFYFLNIRDGQNLYCRKLLVE